jgi:hypothetical protein
MYVLEGHICITGVETLSCFNCVMRFVKSLHILGIDAVNDDMLLFFQH